jgi:hypothetical protein
MHIAIAIVEIQRPGKFMISAAASYFLLLQMLFPK